CQFLVCRDVHRQARLARGGRLACGRRRRSWGLMGGGRPPLVARLLAPDPVVVPSDLRSRATSHRRGTVAAAYQAAPAALCKVMTTESTHLADMAGEIMANPLPGAVAAKIRDITLDQVGLQLAAAGPEYDDYDPVTGMHVGGAVVETGLSVAQWVGARGDE